MAAKYEWREKQLTVRSSFFSKLRFRSPSAMHFIGPTFFRLGGPLDSCRQLAAQPKICWWRTSFWPSSAFVPSNHLRSSRTTHRGRTGSPPIVHSFFLPVPRRGWRNEAHNLPSSSLHAHSIRLRNLTHKDGRPRARDHSLRCCHCPH